MNLSRLALKGVLLASVGRSQGFQKTTTTILQTRLPTAISGGGNKNSLIGFSKAQALFMSSGSEGPTLQNIGKDQMEEILEDYENGGREESGYIVMDVREENEISFTGKISPNTITFPLQKLMQLQAFEMDEDDFEESFGFEKPGLDETLVFSCAAGVRSVHAASFAAQAGYTKLVNYRGGANEWFSPY